MAHTEQGAGDEEEAPGMVPVGVCRPAVTVMVMVEEGQKGRALPPGKKRLLPASSAVRAG